VHVRMGRLLIGCRATGKVVAIQSRKVGIINRIVQVIVIAYVIACVWGERERAVAAATLCPL
jgi:hypothetical protein